MGGMSSGFVIVSVVLRTWVSAMLVLPGPLLACRQGATARGFILRGRGPAFGGSTDDVVGPSRSTEQGMRGSHDEEEAGPSQGSLGANPQGSPHQEAS